MALTAEDMIGIKELLDDVMSRRVDPSFEKIDARLDALRSDVSFMRDDIVVIKEMVKDHSFDIAKLKHRIA